MRRPFVKISTPQQALPCSMHAALSFSLVLRLTLLFFVAIDIAEINHVFNNFVSGDPKVSGSSQDYLGVDILLVITQRKGMQHVCRRKVHLSFCTPSPVIDNIFIQLHWVCGIDDFGNRWRFTIVGFEKRISTVLEPIFGYECSAIKDEDLVRSREKKLGDFGHAL